MEKITPQSEQQQSLDARWYREFEIINSQNDVIECLDGDKEYRSRERDLFESGEKRNPDLDYPEINIESLEKEESELLSLKQAIINEESDEVIKQAYRWRINEKIAEIRMLKAAASGDMKRFKRYAEFVYGKPSKDIFYLSITEIYEQIHKTENSEDESVAKVSRELKDLLPKPEESITLPEKPSSELIQTIHEIFEQEWQSLNLPKIDSDVIEDEVVAKVFERALDSVGANNWQVIIDENRTRVNVSQEQELIKVPKDRTINYPKLKTLVMHEIKRHVERRIRGEDSKLSLLGLGLDRYIRGEEGVAKVTEQGTEGEFKTFATPEMHVAIGLALGIDGKERDFREVYEILIRHFFLKIIRIQSAKEQHTNTEEALRAAKDKAWSHCVRAFRGTDCKTKGVAYTKDIVYREGTIAVWHLVSQDVSEVYRFSIGKYDPTNQRHLWVLSQLGITDKALKEVDEFTS